MRKLLLTLVACIVAIAANAGTIYLVGSGTVDGKSLGGSPNGNCLAVTSADNVYTFNVNNVSWLKISDTNASDWSTFNKNGFTINGKGDYAIKASELGQTFNLWYSNGSSEGTNNINPPSTGEYTYTITVGSKGASNSTLVVTAKSEEVITYDIYLRGSFNDFGVSANYKFTPDSKGEVYTLKGVTLAKGTSFKIADADWGAMNYGNGQSVNANTYYTLTYNGNDMTLNQAINNATITFNTVTEQMYIDDPTAEPDVPVTPNYSNYWVHVGGAFNGYDFYENGQQPVDGIATFTNQAIGDKTFKIHVWNGDKDIYYIMDNADGDVQVPTGEWVQFVEDGYDIYDYVKGATANSVYDVKYNVATNQIYLTLVSGGTEEPGDEITELYVIGNFEGNNNWPVPGKAMTNEGDGIFTIENLTLNAGDGYGYFALTTNGTNNWDLINANRFSPLQGDVTLDAQLNQEVEVENVTKNNGEGAWKVPAGIYTLTYTAEDEMLVVEKTAELTVETPDYPEAFYMISEANGWGEGIEMPYVKDEPNPAGENQHVYQVKGLNLNNPLSFALSEEANAWVNKFGCAENGVFTTATTLQAKPDGGNFVNATDLTDITLTFYYNPTGESWLQLEGTEPAELKLSFVGDNFELGNDINDYLTLTDMGVMISSGGESDGKINITSNPFSFVPNTDLGQYMLNLNYKAGYTLTAAVAPGTPEDAQIDVQNGSGNVVIAGKDLNSTLEVIVTITKDVEPSVLYLAQPFNTIPAVDPQYIEETEPGVYEGVFKFKTGMSYIGFYTVDGDVITKYSKGSFGTFPSDPNEYPLTEDLVKDATSTWSWYIPSLPAGCQGNYNVTVNTNDLTITVDPIYEEAPAPENLYLWGSTNGGVRAVNMAGFVKNGNVYTLKDYEISSYGIFDTSDSEGGATIDRGFSFFLCDNATSFTAAGASRYYGPKATSEDEPNPAIIDLTTANNTYTATATKNGTVDMGGNFIAINPGVYTLTFNYETKEFKAVLDEAYKQVTFEFVGEGNIADPRRYVTAINLSAAEPETLDLYTNTKLFSYNESAGVLFALNEGLADEYTLTVTGPTGIEPGNNTYMIDGSTTEGIANETVSLLGVDNVTFTVTVGEVVDNNAYLGIAEGQFPTAPDKEYALTPDASGYVYTGTVTIQPGQSFNIWYPSYILLGDENEDGDNVKFQPLGPITDDEVELYFTTANTDVLGRVAPTLYGYWTLTNEEPVTINFTLDFNTLSLSLEAVSEDLPEPEPENTSLWFANWTMEPKKGTPATYDIEVSIKNAPEGFTYQGYQFDIALPEGLVLDTENVMANGVKASANTNDDNVTTVIVYFNNDDQQTLTENIISLPVSATYGEIDPGKYNVVISEVVFSSALGQEMVPPVEGWTGTVTIDETEVNVTDITIESVTLDEPSFTTPSSDKVKEVTQGQSVTMTVDIEPEDTTDNIEVSADVEGVTITDNEDGTWTVDTSDVVIPEGQDSVEVTVTVTATDSEGNVTAETEYTFTVKRILLGDSNDNGEVTVADVVTTANYIVYKPIDNFNHPNADVILNDYEVAGARNGITVQDVTATVDIVLGTFDGNQNPAQLQARRNARNIVTADRLVANKVSDNKIAVSLENTYAYAALQAEIAIPEGMKVYSVTAGERAAGFEVVYNVNAEGKLIVVLYNYTNASIANGNGSIFDINVTGNGNMDNCEMINIHASDAQSNGYDLDGFVNANGATGIDGINADEEGVVYYTVDGVQVKNPEKGQILIRVANGEATKVLVK